MRTDIETDVSSDRLERWDRRSRPVVVAAAMAPVLVAAGAPDLGSGAVTAFDAVSWLVFAGDLAARVRIDRHHLRSGEGRFDLAIVLLTLPWSVVGLGADSGLAVFRLARLVRLFRALRVGKAARELWNRLGRLALVVAVTAPLAALTVLRAEPASSGFEDFGDGLWWALVSLTTVGYGDLFPVTPAGRVAAVGLMVVGLGTLGTVAAGLAALFAGEADEEFESRVLDELTSLRDQVAALEARLGDPRTGSPDDPG